MKFTVQPKEPVKMQDLHYGDFAIISDPQVIDAYKKKLVTMVQDGEEYYGNIFGAWCIRKYRNSHRCGGDSYR